MKEKSAWDKFFDDTEDIQCISCLDAYVLKYAIDGCWVQIDRHSSDKDSKFTLSIRGMMKMIIACMKVIFARNGRKRMFTIRH